MIWLEWYDHVITQNERGNLVVFGLWKYVVRCFVFSI